MRSIIINQQEATGNLSRNILLSPPFQADDIYRQMQLSYPKFFKMDPLCRWAFIGAELLCGHGDSSVYRDVPPEKTGMILATGSGCMDVDQQYLQSMREVASPGLFVYTLPNIMLGELSIRHGFKGEQLCLVQPEPDSTEIMFGARDMLLYRGMEACLCGWVNVDKASPHIKLWWLTRTTLKQSDVPTA